MNPAWPILSILDLLLISHGIVTSFHWWHFAGIIFFTICMFSGFREVTNARDKEYVNPPSLKDKAEYQKYLEFLTKARKQMQGDAFVSNQTRQYQWEARKQFLEKFGRLPSEKEWTIIDLAAKWTAEDDLENEQRF